ncbi:MULTISPECIES: MAPEG family protein [Pseudanabaena]|uniref:Membrane-associated protein in eicosanoid and glutathione metabolism (MAPEG) n=2 Tax=Pseudanabaena TaxID=1152 RepID=L8N7J9_9CYAN|nr:MULTISPECIES: MAPEG family protein [Pseudanabaena]ELS34208.1 membrane-associated protein in eicosanoid and glutathione metabolism (MAPEG) [Pseudanabaena biceps PCC 7429]MDG3493569.1 MAPEG family protein [Pseudanabaena catenata USMAC16]
MDIKTLVLPAIVTLVALLVYFGLGIGVGVARVKYKIMPPQTTGNEDFERVYRVHQNTLEQMIIFLPCLWLFSIFVNPNWGTILGSVWIVGRIGYAWGYYIEASKRAAGNAIASLALLALMFGTLFNLVRGLFYV